MPNYDLITILGPTASGKTPFAAALAYEYRNYQCRLPSNIQGNGSRHRKRFGRLYGQWT